MKKYKFLVIIAVAALFTACIGYEPVYKSEFNINNESGSDLTLVIYYHAVPTPITVSISNTTSYKLERFSYGEFPDPFMEYGVDSVVVKYKDNKCLKYGVETPQTNENIMFLDAYDAKVINAEYCVYDFTFSNSDYMKAK